MAAPDGIHASNTKPGQIYLEGHADNAGTPTCLLVSSMSSGDQFFLLTCAHVLVPEDAAPASLQEQGVCVVGVDGSEHRIGRLHAWSTSGLPTGALADTDAALVNLDITPADLATLLPSLPLPAGSSGVLMAGDRVHVTGRESRTQCDYTIVDVDVVLPDAYPDRWILTPFGLRIRNVVSTKAVDEELEKGDSGAPVFNSADDLVGIHFLGGGTHGYFVRIKATLSYFNQPPLYMDLEVVTSRMSAGREMLAKRPVPQGGGDLPDIAMRESGAEAPLPLLPPAVPLPVSDPDAAVTILAKTLWGEARGEPLKGIQAVAAVVANRVRLGPRIYGRTVEAVCLKKWQFSCWNPGDPNRLRLDHIPATDGTYGICRQVAEQALAGALADPTDGATHYCAASLNPMPSWATEDRLCAVIGDHRFYRNVDLVASPAGRTRRKGGRP